MSTFGKRKFRDNSSADEERNEKRVQKRPNNSKNGRYSAKNKSAWPDLLQKLDSQLLENQISYLSKPCEVAAIKEKVPEPEFKPFIPSLIKPNEEPYEKDIRDMHNDVIKKLYLLRRTLSSNLRPEEAPARQRDSLSNPPRPRRQSHL